MAKIGGNILGKVLTKQKTGTNEIGEPILNWVESYSIKGWLGMQTGDSPRNNYNTKLEESTHVFLCDYHSGIYSLADKDVRMEIKGKMYDVMYIDNPDEMDEQLEIYLKKVGG